MTNRSIHRSHLGQVAPSLQALVSGGFLKSASRIANVLALGPSAS